MLIYVFNVTPCKKYLDINWIQLYCHTPGSHFFLVFLVRGCLDLHGTLSLCNLSSSVFNLYVCNSISWTSCTNLTDILSLLLSNTFFSPFRVSSWHPNSVIQPLRRPERPVRTSTWSNRIDRTFKTSFYFLLIFTYWNQTFKPIITINYILHSNFLVVQFSFCELSINM